MPFKAPAGAVVVQNWETGQIIALASYPTFDNRWFESDLSGGKFEEIFDATDIEALEYDDEGEVIPESVKTDPDRSTLVNRAIQGRYNLGSTFKPFTAYAALSTDLLSTSDRYQDSGTYKNAVGRQRQVRLWPRAVCLQERHLRQWATMRLWISRRRDSTRRLERRVFLSRG